MSVEAQARMRGRLVRRAVFAVSMVCLLSASVASADSQRVLSVPWRHQQTPVWCWAATIAMVVGYTQSFSVQDCEVLAEYDMRSGGTGLCCMGAPGCVRGGGFSEMEAILGGIFGVHGSLKGRALSYDEVVAQIDRQRPLIASLTPGNGSGHVIVVSGYRKPADVVITDPEGFGPTIIPYRALLNHPTYGSWAATFVIDSNRSPAPLCRRALEPLPGGAMRPHAVCQSNDNFDVQSSSPVPGPAPNVNAPPRSQPPRPDPQRCLDACDRREDSCKDAASSERDNCNGRGAMFCGQTAGCPCDGYVGQMFFACRARCEACLTNVSAACDRTNDGAVDRCERRADQCRDDCRSN